MQLFTPPDVDFPDAAQAQLSTVWPLPRIPKYGYFPGARPGGQLAMCADLSIRGVRAIRPENSCTLR